MIPPLPRRVLIALLATAALLPAVDGPDPLDDVIGFAWERATEASFAHDHHRAIAYIDLAIDLAPGHAELYTKRSGEYQRLERYPEAIADLQRALGLEPDAIDAMIGLAANFHHLGQDERVGEWRAKAVAYRPDGPYDAMLKDIGLFALAVQVGDLEQAQAMAATLPQHQAEHGRMGDWLRSDADFDRVRETEWFQRLLAQLPAE